jgi:hypothetical protein
MVARRVAPPRTWIPVVHSVTCPQWRNCPLVTRLVRKVLLYGIGVLSIPFSKKHCFKLYCGLLESSSRFVPSLTSDMFKYLPIYACFFDIFPWKYCKPFLIFAILATHLPPSSFVI